MLAESFILRLEAMMRNTHAQTGSGRDMRFVPILRSVYPASNQQLLSTKETSTKES